MKERKKSQESERHLETLMKGLEILDCLQGRPAMSITEIANELGIYKSRVMRLCGTLEHMGYVVFDERERVYRLGPRIMSLARVYEGSNPLVPLLRPTMESLFEALGKTISFAILHNKGQICAYRVSEEQNFKEPSIYQERTLHHGASGRVLLAFAPEHFREIFFSERESYPALTPHTITSPQKLWEEVLKTQKSGYAITSDERVMWSIGIAAPVFQFSDILVGSLSVSGKKEDFSEEFIDRSLTLLLKATAALSEKMGYRR